MFLQIACYHYALLTLLSFLQKFVSLKSAVDMQWKCKFCVYFCEKSSTLIAQYMDITFSLRRKELVEKEPSVKETLQRWPALFRESQVIKTHFI